MSALIFVSSALQQPRHQKRINALSSEFECDILYFERDKYKINYNGFDTLAKSMGAVKDGQYLSRLFSLFRLFLYLVKSKNKFVYCTALDQAVVAFLARKKVFLELGDLVAVGKTSQFYLRLDKWVTGKVIGLILTSPFFWSSHYKRLGVIDERDYLLIENKLPPLLRKEIDASRAISSKNVRRDKIKIGVIGSLAFKKPLEKLASLAMLRGDIEVHVFGAGMVEIFEGVSNCFLHGPFKNPDDLRVIYEAIDVNFVVYDAANENVKIALPNKLYESIAFCKPIICASNVALAEIVEGRNIGVACDADSIGSAIDQVSKDYSFFVRNMQGLGEHEYLDLTRAQLLAFVKDRMGKV